MTDQQHPIIPSQDQVYRWWWEACKRPPSSFYEKLDYVAAKATEWGWQQRDASVPGELQQARDQELEACCEWVLHDLGYDIAIRFQAARRPKSPGLAEEALIELCNLVDDLRRHGLGYTSDTIRAALERLQELEGQGDG